MPAVFETITANISGLVKHKTLEGIDYLVVPAVMITEGVHAGNNGPLFYSNNELAKVPAAWNSKPVTVYHPTVNGSFVSASLTPEIVEKYKVGMIMNARYIPAKKPRKKGGVTANEADVGKLHCDVYLRTDRMMAIDARVVEGLESGTMMEVSTGLFSEHVPETGTFNGKEYSYKVTNIHPDHLAILPDKEGACSIADGAGLLRVNEASFGRIRDAVALALRAGDPAAEMYGPPYVEEIWEDKVVYCDRDGMLWSRNYTFSEPNIVEFTGTPEAVIRVTEYRTAGGELVGNATAQPPKPGKGNEMNRNDLVSKIITNSGGVWTEADRGRLLGMPDAALTALQGGAPAPAAPAPALVPASTPAAPAATAPTAPTANAAPATPAAPHQPPANLDAALGLLANQYGESFAAPIREILNRDAAAKTALVQKITGNQANRFTPEYLQQQPLDALQAICDMMPQAASPTTNNAPAAPAPATFYPGTGGPAPATAPVIANEAQSGPHLVATGWGSPAAK